MKKYLAVAALIALSACTDKEPTETELQSALQSYVKMQMGQMFGSPEQAMMLGVMSGSAQGLESQMMQQSILSEMDVTVNNLRKIECVERGDSRYNCDVIADIEMDFGENLNNIARLMGVPMTQSGISTNLLVENGSDGWVVLREE